MSRVVEISKVGPERCNDILTILNEVWPEFVMDESELRHQFDLDHTLRADYWVAFIDAVPCGLIEVGPVSGTYHPRRWRVEVAVREAFRNEGLGKSLYDRGRELIEPSDPLTVVSHVREQDEVSIKFAETRGFREIKRDFISKLDLHNLDEAVLKNLIERELPTETRIVSGSEIDSPQFRKDMHLVFEEIRRDIPRSFAPTPLTFEQFEAAFLDDGLDWGCSMFALFENKPIAFSVGFRSGDPSVLMQGLTGVTRDHRGHGLAQSLKARLIAAARAAGFSSIGTDNDTRNAPMLTINDKLGFQRQKGFIQYLWGDDGS